ncbi:LuxR C-terminal-related transcriptional regulator [Variovorax sp. Sphag1AA]|uniref:LuxR C-terminal-related transcriptional regulator n=1 Tax=Variovorax sp. Sphag1AA TaxID=2587027 RepID=UPI001616C9B0|nr:LuxR C-terminal-related transcriptional regulator [Variovorax sp. Sphag1AA]MBB3176649.1 LuxR family maltose regulon positive regulatory protein [Variovorax sp. Sphag1AA]
MSATPTPPKPIVSTKLVPPRGAGRVVARDKLIAQMLEARRRRCFVVQGPAGCGKTTALIAWRQALLPLGFDVAWLTLTPEDNEPTRLIDYLLASLAQVDAAITHEAAELAGHGIDSEAVERTVVALVRGIARHPRDLVLVLDDLHQLSDARIHEALQWLLDYSPPNLHVVLTSRTAVPLSLARLRAQGLVLELDLRDLRFSQAESERFLQAQLGTIDHRDAVLLHELTDGWVAGLQLYAIDWKKRRQESGGDAKVPSEFTRAHVQDAKTFASYFEREVLSRLAPQELELLISVSTCNRFCAPLCAALAGRPEAVQDMAALLARLEADNLFIVPVESTERETWYRLHPLLRETLRARFGRRSEARRLHVHVAAWQWFRTHGLLDEAVRHAVQAGESSAAADLLERSGYGLAVRGELRKLIGLVRQLPPEEVQSRPLLRLWMIRLELYSRDFDACVASIASLRAQLPEDDAVNHFTLTMLQATLAIQRDDIGSAMNLLPQLLQTPADADAMTIGGRDNILSWLYMQRGEYERARQVQLDNPTRLIDGVPLLGTASGTLQGRCLIGLSYAMQGQMTKAERIYRDVLREAELGGSACTDPRHLATALLGEVLYEQNEPEAVRQLLEDRVEVLERVSIPDSVLRLFYMLSAAHWIAGRRLESFACLERLEDYATDLGLDRLLVYSLASQMYRRLLLGEHQQAEELLQRLEELGKRQTRSDSEPFNETAVIIERVRIRWLIALGKFDAAAERIDPLIAWMESRSRQRLIAQMLLLRAVIESRRGHRPVARECVISALKLGHRLGLRRTLLDADPAATEMIRQIGSDPALDPVLAFYVERLCPPGSSSDVGAASAPASPSPTAPIEALSERELDVVRLLAQALPNKKIARTLGLSPETVKWHLKNIYGKLGVSGRDEAVARVRDLTL